MCSSIYKHYKPVFLVLLAVMSKFCPRAGVTVFLSGVCTKNSNGISQVRGVTNVWSLLVYLQLQSSALWQLTNIIAPDIGAVLPGQLLNSLMSAVTGLYCPGHSCLI